MNWPIVIGLIAGSYFLFNKYMNVSTFAKTANYTTKLKFFRFQTVFEIRFGLEITVLNPSQLSLTIKNPLVQVLYAGKQLTQSAFNITTISIKPLASTVLPTLEFSINLISNASVIIAMIKAMLKGVKLTNIKNAQSIIEKNQDAFMKLMDLQLTAYINNTPVTTKLNLG